MSRGVKLGYVYIDADGKKQIVYARNLAEAQKLAPKGVKIERWYYEGA